LRHFRLTKIDHFSCASLIQIQISLHFSGDQFGNYMSLHGDRLVIGASGNKKASITGGKALTNSGAAYVFVRTP
jgi:hypothetical protein